LLRARAAQMRHAFTCANLVDTKGRALPFNADVTLQCDDQGTPWSLRFFGLLVVQYPEGSFFERVFGWRFLDPIAVAQRMADTTPAGTTLIALSHLGLRHDRILAERVPRLDLILGGHSHDTLPAPEVVAGVPIVHAGPYGAFASRTELAKDATGRARITDFALEPLT
jgi:2',3'-cyclic-nucleotide 2'-phosphodiesterase (5'-nucleotidase family)